MEFTAEWKSLWPISSTFSAPLLIPNTNPETPLGPLIFTPKPDSATTLFHSPSLSPRLPPPYPDLSLPRFLQNCCSVPSSATSISSLLGHQLLDYSSSFHGFNSLQLLQIPKKNLIVVFFPAGENSDHVGFSLLSVKDGILNAPSQRGKFFQLVKESGNVNRQRITHLLVNTVDGFCGDENGDDMFGDVRNVNKRNRVVTVVGFLMVCTNYSVYWYRIGIITVNGQDECSVCLDYLGCTNVRMLRGSAVASACWSPHLREECLVLLENGDLLLFDVNYFSGEKAKSISLVSGNKNVFKKKLHVSLTDELGIEKDSGNEVQHWFECEFSWHPRIFIASNRKEVFLVDLRSSGECKVSCLLKLKMFSMRKNDGFFALSSAGSDRFSFTVATRYLLLLFDVRKFDMQKPLMPVLRWSHVIRNPQYMTVFRLSDLRANAQGAEYKLASESGYCVMLGSFWDSEFNIFCYGPDCNRNGSVSSETSKCAWGLPSELSLSGSDCKCGSCHVKEEFLKASQPVWIDWRQKKHLILGFGILKSYFSAQLSSLDSFGGFMLIRLTSSGKLEAQQYLAAWESDNFLESCHKRKSFYLEDNLVYDCDVSEYDGVKKFQHMKLEFLNAYLKGQLAKYIAKRRDKSKDSDENAQKKYKSESNFHQEICCRMKAFGLPKDRSFHAVSAVLKDISLPTSIHEIALRSMCAVLPPNLLHLSFSTYPDFEEDLENHNEPLEFLDIPDQPQVPPFPFRKPSYRSNRWSSKVQPSDALVGPILPPLFLTTLHKLCMEELKEERVLYVEESKAFSPHAQLKHQCDKVMEVVEEHISGADAKTHHEDFASLADDTEYMSCATQKPKLSCHKPSAFFENLSSVSLKKTRSENYIFSTHVFRRSQELASDLSAEMLGQELFDVGCPIELKFHDNTREFGPKELETLRHLKKRDLDLQRSFGPYQDYINGRDELK